VTEGQRRIADVDARTVSYYDRTAVAYDDQVDGVAVNRTIRAAFRRRVLAATPSDDTILDLGCGTGIDAAWYAEQGYRVIAYDVSAGMMDRLRSRCASAIDAGTVTPVVGASDVLARQLESSGPVGTVAANFAVLNHVADLDGALRQLAPHVTPGGTVLASLLSPCHWRDMAGRWWWNAAIGTAWHGAITARGAVTTHRFLPGVLRRAAVPEFELAELLGLEHCADGRAMRPIRAWNAFRTPFWLAIWRKPC